MPTLAELIPPTKELTYLERKFFRHVLNGAKPTDAARLAFDVGSAKSASTRAGQVLKKYGIRLADIMDHMGLTDEEDLKHLLRLRKAKTTRFFAHEGEVVDTRTVNDHGTQIRALELTLELKSYMNKGGANVQVNNQISVIQHMREALREEDRSLKQQAQQ